MFSSADGSPFHYLRVGRALKAIADRAGLNEEGRAKLRWHDLRHTAASLLIAEGLNVVYVSRQLGHANPSITLTVYGHEFGRTEHAERARSAMDAALGNKWATSDGKQAESGPPEHGAEVAQLREIGNGGN